MTNSESKRRILADYLVNTECPVNLESEDWKTADDFESPIK